jgi:hypothetical protein
VAGKPAEAGVELIVIVRLGRMIQYTAASRFNR